MSAIKSDYKEDAIARIQEQISSVKNKISVLSREVGSDYTGNKVDDALIAVGADIQRDYWESRLLELEGMLADYASTPIITTSSHKTKGVMVGDVLLLQRHDSGKKCEFQLVDRIDLFPDPAQSVKPLSVSSPLGKLLIGIRPGEKVKIETPSGIVIYELISISRG